MRKLTWSRIKILRMLSVWSIVLSVGSMTNTYVSAQTLRGPIKKLTEADIYGRRILELEFEGELEPALELCNEYIMKYPNDSSAYSTRAFIETNMGLTDAAHKDRLKAYSIEKQSSNKLGIAFCLYELGRYKEALKAAADSISSFEPAARCLRARCFNKLGKYQHAQTEATWVLRNYPKYPYAHFYRGRANVKLKNYKLAVSDLSAALKEGVYINSRSDLAEIHRLRSIAFTNLGKKDLAKADYSEYKNLLAEKSESSVDSNRELQKEEKFSVPSPGPMDLTPDKKSKAKKLKIPTTKRDFYKIIDKANKKLKKNPKDAFAYIDLGYAYGNLDQPQRDLEYCNKAIAIDPNIPVSYSERAYAYLCLKQEDKALKDLAKAIELDPKNSAFYKTRGWIYGRQGKYSLAIKECTKSISIYDGFSPAFYCRGKAYLSLGQYDKAIADYSKAIELYPNEDVDYYIERGFTYNCIDNYQKALTDLNTAVKMEPDNYEALLYRSVSLSNMGDHRAAVSNLNEVIRLNPKLPDGYRNRGLAYLNLSNNKRAMRDLNKAIALDPKNALAFQYRGKAYINSEQYQEAVHDLSKAIKLDSKRKYCYLKLAEVYKKLKQFDKASEIQKKLVEVMQSKKMTAIVKSPGDKKAQKIRTVKSKLSVPLNRKLFAELEKKIDLSTPSDRTAPMLYWLLDKKGKELKQLKYQTVKPFTDGLAAVTNKKYKTGYINTSGELVIPMQFEQGMPFSDGLAWVRTSKNTMGCIDHSGKQVLKNIKLATVKEFSNGLAAISVQVKNAEKLWGFIDKTGKMVIPAKYESVRSFKSGLAAAFLKDKWFFINSKGEQVTSSYDLVTEFADGLAAVCKDKKWGYIEANGKVKIEFQFREAGPFGDGMAAVKTDGKYSFIDKDGKTIIPPSYKNAGKFSNGLCPVQLASRKWGYIDSKGQLTINGEFESAGPFVESKAIVRKSGKMRFILPSGKYSTTKSYMFIFPSNSPYTIAMTKNWNHPTMRSLLMSSHLDGFELKKDKSSENGLYIPKDLNDAVAQLNDRLPEKAKSDIRAIKQDEMVNYHFSALGLGLRNNWGLWKGFRLAKYFNSIGIFHPDDMSAVILKSYWCKLHNQTLDLDKEVKYYKKYWEGTVVGRGKTKNKNSTPAKDFVERAMYTYIQTKEE